MCILFVFGLGLSSTNSTTSHHSFNNAEINWVEYPKRKKKNCLIYGEQSWDCIRIWKSGRNIWPLTTQDISGLICIYLPESQHSCWTMKEQIDEFFNNLWMLMITKHKEGIYNTVCIVVLLMLPLLVFFTSVVVCCHCCSFLCRGHDCCCCRGSDTLTGAQVEKKRQKKRNGGQNEDLWISVKMDLMTPDRLALTVV